MVTFVSCSYGSFDYGTYYGTVTLYKPAVTAGDLMFAHLVGEINIRTVPAGWTLLHSAINNRDYLYYKIASGSEPNSYVWECSDYAQGSIDVFRGVNTITPINVSSYGESTASTGLITGTTVTPTIIGGTLCLFTTLTESSLQGGGFNNHRISTDNPTVWAKNYTTGFGGGGTFPAFGMAYAYRPQKTTTGTAYVNASGASYSRGVIYSVVLSPPTYNLVLSAGVGGTVTGPGSGTHVCGKGIVITITAVPDAGYHFVAWTGGVGTVADPSSASTTVTINNNYNIQATFAKDFYEEGYIGDVIDCSADVTAYNLLEWDKVIPSVNQVIYIQYRSSPDLVTWSDWKIKNTSPITSFAIPVQRYFEWRIFLTTTDKKVTPQLDELHLQIKKEI